MRIPPLMSIAVLSSLFLAANLMAQNAPARRPGGMAQPGGMMLQQSRYQQTLAALGDLNLRPDFTLSKEQKEKLQAIRDDVRKTEDKWRDEHAADFEKLRDEMQAARQDRDQEKMRDVMAKRRDLIQSMPKIDDAAKQIKDLLTEDQAKALETRIKERQEELRDRMGMGMGMGGMGGRGPQGGRQ